ncbi:Cutinase [Penicillium griseofulvum]|uniref:Leucine carboxyl methyltransferase 1 n=1 Tax=Penicillium patulum TaxID=5078 RepID=A0A135LP12_PENPA|nr:Cutinase [Penicillium griseofulvum]KXG50700.1 Cutinase [Penicillium griseofulvum]
MVSKILTFSLLAGALAVPVEVDIEKRIDCPSIHIFGARGTTEPPGYGASNTVVNGLLSAYPGSTAEAINYPACGGQASCGGLSYSGSIAQGIAAVASAVNAYNKQCPSTKLVLTGYSQGGEIMDAALCGGGVPNQGYTNPAVQISTSAVTMVKAAIFMGDPLYVAGLPYDVGTCAAGGFDARPSGFNCPSASKIQSYCDAQDPYCCNGNNDATHQSYGAKYGTQAIAFVKNKADKWEIPHHGSSKLQASFIMATHIPNLNTLRRGRGRGRIGRTEETGPSGKDRIVQGTDNDASISRLSAVELGYLEDAYAAALTPAGHPRAGTYARTTAIDQLVARFLGPCSPENTHKKQIISLGAGSDTRVFRLLSSRQTPDFVYHELDFAVNTADKIRAIRSAPILQRALGIDSSEGSTEKNTGVTVSEAGDALHSPSYHVHPVDLRSLPGCSDPAGALPGVETGLPTLLISECCLVYLSPIEAEQVVAFFTQRLFGHGRAASGLGDSLQEAQADMSPLGLILYEPIRPNDAFGRTMVSNLAARGIQLKTLPTYASLEAQRGRFREQGFGNGQAVADIEFIWKRWVNEDEKERVAGLEMLDEMEEWELLARHYCIAWGWRDRDDVPAFAGWKDLEAQQGE